MQLEKYHSPIEVSMDRGELKHRITLEKLTDPKANENGFTIDTDAFVPFKTIWASINNLFGKEFWAAKATNSENTVEFIVRYSKDIENINSKIYRIKWNERYFNITFIDNIKYQNKWLKLKAVEVV